MKKASYFGIPCYYNELTDELWGRNKFYDILVDIAIWFDVNLGSCEIKIKIYEKNDNK